METKTTIVITADDGAKLKHALMQAMNSDEKYGEEQYARCLDQFSHDLTRFAQCAFKLGRDFEKNNRGS